MARSTPLSEALDAVIPDGKILRDVERLLGEIGREPVELEDGKVHLPENPALDIVTKRFVWDEYPCHLTPLAALVAIGGLQPEPATGSPLAGICFVLVHYNDECNEVTVDFSRRMP